MRDDRRLDATKVVRRSRAARWAVPAAIAAITFLAFLPALRAGFVSWDDERNFVTNPHYRGLGFAQLRWMWSTFLLGHYVPLSWMTLGADYLLWGMNATGYHLTNLAFHCANAVIVYYLSRRILSLAIAAPVFSSAATATTPALSGAGINLASAFAALLFAVHPLRVESVAWITERRDVVSGFFYLLCILAYLRSVRVEGVEKRGYFAALVLFICALLSKGTAVTAPAVLLLLNVYPLRRLGGSRGWWTPDARSVYAGLVPFAVPAAGIVALSIFALHPPEQLPIAGKLAVSAYSLVFYLWKTLVPVGLSPLYGMPVRVDPLSGRFALAYGVVALLGVAACLMRKRSPGTVAALLAFVAISLPMLGIVQNGPQIAADRYTYHAAPALAILVAAAFLQLSRRISPTFVVTAGAFGILILAGLTWSQTSVWQSSERLWARVLEVEPDSPVGHSGQANILFQENRVSEGIAHSVRAIELAPDFAEGYNDLGVGLARAGRPTDAIERYQRALALKPQFDEAESNWGVVLAQLGQIDSAIVHYRRALAANPDSPDAEVNWGNALVRAGRPDEAIEHYRKALWIRPDDADAEHNWGVALARQGKYAEAIQHFERALAIDPDHAEAKEYLARATQLLREQSRGPY